MSMKKFVRKPEFVARIAEKVGLSEWKTEQVINTVMIEIRKSIDKGESVKFHMIGTFYPGVNAPTRFFNPHTNTMQEVPKKFVPKFRLSRKWREYFNNRRQSNESRSEDNTV